MVEMDKAVWPIRIAVSGKMRSGKDTVARRLVERHGFVRYAFADRLKELASELFGMDSGNKNRAILVALGRRMVEIDKLVWVRQVLDRVPLSANVVIPDLRFGYELVELRRLGFRLVRVEISQAKQLKRLSQTEPGTDLSLLNDPSETSLDKWQEWDWRLDGGVSVDRFYAEVDRMLDEFRRKA